MTDLVMIFCGSFIGTLIVLLTVSLVEIWILKKENEQIKQLIKETLESTPIEHSLAVKLKNSIREMYK